MSVTLIQFVPPNPSNAYADHPIAAALGRRLFFEARLSRNGQISCATCHQPERYFTDGNARSIGVGKVMRNAPTIVGAAGNRWFYWDGRRDSLWSQAMIPFEAPDEMGSDRVAVVRFVLEDATYVADYTKIFGEVPADFEWENLPDHAGPFGSLEARDAWARLSNFQQQAVNRIYTNLGKSIAAYERTLIPQPTRFDKFLKSLSDVSESLESERLTADEIAGARLFMDKQRTQCLQCHNGPTLSNGDFHNTGSGNFSKEHLDFGREFGLRAVLMDEFNCLGPYSDAKPRECTELIFLNKDSHIPMRGAFKVPTLRGLRQTAPYFHDGRFETLGEVLEHYNSPPSIAEVGPHELKPMDLSGEELEQLEHFLLTLSD